MKQEHESLNSYRAILLFVKSLNFAEPLTPEHRSLCMAKSKLHFEIGPDGLTGRERQALKAILKDNRLSMEELGKALTVSKERACQLRDALIRKGRVTRRPGIARGLEPIVKL